MDPIGVVPVFISSVAGTDDAGRRAILRKALFIAAAVLVFFIFAGKLILTFFGITPGAFYVSGGILFFLISLDMIYNKPRRSKRTPDEDTEDTTLHGVFPLAIPLIAGPGLITTIMLYVTSGDSWIVSVAMLIAAVGLSLLVEYTVLRCSRLILHVMGKTGVYVLEKIMGLVLAGLAVQLIYDGLVRLGIV